MAKRIATIEEKGILPAEVAEQYSVKDGLLSIFVSNEFGRVVLSEITLEFAERLAEAGYLIRKNA
ncbi:MAG TPA: hypothetical protein VGK59_10890 [Ohtaekwangia sp.]